MPEPSDLSRELAQLIEEEGPISIERFMSAANKHYYATRDAIGAAGDFITAPEISQMFGEIVGAALADCWLRAGSPADAAYVELGPGRGTLAADGYAALRTAAGTRSLACWRMSPATLPSASPLARPARPGSAPGRPGSSRRGRCRRSPG